VSGGTAATRIVGAAAIAVLVAAVLAPLGTMVVQSLRVTEVVSAKGQAWRVAGDAWRSEDGYWHFKIANEANPEDPTPQMLSAAQVREVHTVWSLGHYHDVVASPRLRGLLWNSLVVAGGGALLALLLGLPAGWLVARTTLPGRRLLAVALAAPLLLPPFFSAMGVSDRMGAWLGALGFSGGSLQIVNSIVCFGSLFFPIAALLCGRALAAVPAGLVESATLLRGPRAAFRAVVLPSVLPSALAAFTLAFVLALSDFAVPDLLGVFLPKGAIPVHVFATEVFLQWKHGSPGQGVATCVPFVAVTLGLVALAAFFVRRTPTATTGASFRPRPRVALSPVGAVVGWAFALALLALSVGLPIEGVCSWGFSPTRVPATVRQSPGLGDQTVRWLRIGGLAALVGTALAVVLARFAVRGRRPARWLAGLSGALPLAVPGMVLMVGTLLLWADVRSEWVRESLLRPVLLLSGRFLPYALLATWLAFREVDRGLEDAARLGGAGPATRAARVWAPLSWRGVVAGFLLVLVFALRELDAIVMIEPNVLPVRIYDKVHQGKTGDVADLSMLYLAIVMVPGLVAAALSRPRREGRGRVAVS
jgi:iron(III) transport system permease protein